ncbi:MAG: tRNA (N6-isopentenyl adenosine(37)-C2)-methylthiotransferase MiaB [Oscillospiraceae bacterium]|jgi:tRNA-2-methylthio-N6-dimethylallyladenosine synthase|nr:tRNA (N6-isopentenyl adenosine(37)-C2)-methylthiotransferase MiaB [Oscillospiraceae bacterium]
MLAFVKTFGCQLNVADGEKIKSQLVNIGYELTDIPEIADLILFNTCAVRENAENRVFGHIGRAKYFKERNKNLIIGLCGCMANEPETIEKLKAHYSCVDIIFGTSAISKLPEMLADIKKNKYNEEYFELNTETDEGLGQVRESKYKASVPIMYGCNNFCTYCIVPYVRGRERSREVGKILEEITELVSKGYKEIMLLGQNVNSYAYDFPLLLKKINDIQGDFWVRFMSSHPKDCSKELIDTVAECGKICKHIHLPVQSGSNDVLKRMNRNYTREKYFEIIDYAKKKIPEVAFTSDIIVGFPNETEEDFLNTLEVIEKVRYNNIYNFIYSKRSGTKAADYLDSITHKEKTERMARLIALQQKISLENNGLLVGKTVKVLVEENNIGRTEGMIMVELDKTIEEGNIVEVKITGQKSIYLKGEVI